MNRWMLILVAVGSTAGFGFGQEPIDLLKLIPSSVNTIAVINVNDILASPRAVKDGWSKKNHLEYLAGAVPIHPNTERILLAKEMNPESPSQGGVLAIIPLKNPLDIAKFAESRSGTIDTVGGEPVAIISNDIIGVKLGDKLLGMMKTDSRQEVARWLRHTKTAKESLQDKYLNAFAFNSGTKHHIAIAIGTEDLFHPKQIALAVTGSQVLNADKTHATSIEAYLAKLTGIRFVADIKESGISAEVRIDSAAPAKVDPAVIKAFFIELLDNNGAALEDLTAAAVSIDGNTVTLAFQISDPELARVMSLVAPPIDRIATDEAIAIVPAGVSATASQIYYRAVGRIVDDLKEQNKKAKDYLKTALWHETAANKIEAISVIHVEPLVVEYAVTVATRLRVIAESLKGVPVQNADLQQKTYMVGGLSRATIWRSGHMRINPWLYNGPQVFQTNLPEIREKQSQVIRDDEANRAKLWAMIDGQKSELRGDVLKKSGTDLEAAPSK